ncbi:MULTISPECIES: hypothetical protein [Chelatococcus]|uniref:Uncharacterized protein n=1 Tax=Chelatococcus caeni TaxID=1348468 RepID=A0A840BW87_9HYPH|nr:MULTISPECIES: hypothetical protein [Chelatococcus]MBB4015738.1 hypothetical protein [Chelatococcus caeni]
MNETFPNLLRAWLALLVSRFSAANVEQSDAPPPQSVRVREDADDAARLTDEHVLWGWVPHGLW